MSNVQPIRVAIPFTKLSAEQRDDPKILEDEIKFREQLLVQAGKQAEIDEPKGDLLKLQKQHVKVTDKLFAEEKRAAAKAKSIEEKEFKTPRDHAVYLLLLRDARQQLLLENIKNQWECNDFDISNPSNFTIEYCNTHNITIYPNNKMRRNNTDYTTTTLVNDLRSEQNKLGIKEFLSLAVIPGAVENVLLNVTKEAKLKFIKEFKNPSYDERKIGYNNFLTLAENWLGKNSKTRITRLQGSPDSYDMEECALYTWLAQAKYKIIHQETPADMRPFSKHLYSDRKGIGKTFPEERLLFINSNTDLGLFTSPATPAQLFDSREIALKTEYNIVFLDDFDSIEEKYMESWKSIVTARSLSAKFLYTNSTTKLTLALAIASVGNYNFGEKVYNEKRERRTIQLHIDGDCPKGSLTLDPNVFENLDYRSIWDGIDETKYNLVWDEFPDEVIESQELQTSETWYDNWVEWMVENKVTTNGPISSIHQFIEDYYIEQYCHRTIDDHQKRIRKIHDDKTIKSRLTQDPTFSGYGTVIHNKVRRKWTLDFDFTKVGKYG